MEKLTEHFTLSEFTTSQEAIRKGIDNTPSADAVEHLRALCENVLEPLRAALGSVAISSGYRCLELNRAIGSGDTSQHVEGRAADLSVPGHPLDYVYNWLYEHTPFDQIIREFPPGGWVHVSYDPGKNRRHGMIAVKRNGKTVYEPMGTIS